MHKKILNNLFLFTLLNFICSCSNTKTTTAPGNNLDNLAKEYVQLGLFIGNFDTDFVDAYYGPESLKVPASGKTFPKDSLLLAVDSLTGVISSVQNDGKDQQKRKVWMLQQLKAFKERIRIFSGSTKSFDEEAMELFGVKPPHFKDAHYSALINELDAILPGSGAIPDRLQQLNSRFIIPKEKVDTVFKTAIQEARQRTKQYYKVPANEDFELEYVTGKSWSGYNWYKGNYKSLIQISNDVPLYIERAIDLACHEGYPGHHVYNMLLEENLYNKKGWVEISLYPLFSPQSLIAEGSANYGIELAFPGDEKINYLKNVLLPLAGLDTTGIGAYLKGITIMRKLNFLRNEVASDLFDKKINEEGAVTKLMTLGLMGKESATRSVQFIKKYRSYVLNYNYGLQLISDYIEKGSPTKEEKWKRFYTLLSNPVVPRDLIK